MAVQNTFIATAHAFTGLVDAVPASRLAGPGLGDWTVRDLVGHAVSAGLAGVLTALGRPASTEDIATPEAYYALAKTVDPAVVDAVVALSTTDARQWGARLGERPADQVRQLASQVVTAVSGTAPDALVTTAAGGMRLGRWLPTRTFELVVHGFDLAAAVDLPFEPPVDALAESAALAARLAAVTGDGRAVVLALTGRHDLAAGFSVV
ncbi:maleylpyruvate isomerase N-terminal domain-containing protein [Lentzea albida]|uniref:TIGR03083 family protein n=1 Tax=Lentzea albida TaxID=65499 RepID=A0A1H9IUT7_9PSEU|nr:maleylpyruvate isomerase N-terminal domain-containing protein [Lentzea albida]SEQ78541.1 TIGR03083 family protein [Lentzea albida]